MNKEEIKEFVEGMIEYHCSEFGLEREEVIDVVITNIVYSYYESMITEQELVDCCEYLGYEVDLEQVRKDKEELTKKKYMRKYYAEKGKKYARKVEQEGN